jgi:hypothetical protein
MGTNIAQLPGMGGVLRVATPPTVSDADIDLDGELLTQAIRKVT